MKKLNNALNEINDKYIEEAAQSERLQRNTAKTVRNIAVPVVSAAAVVGLCFGMTKLGVFGGKEGVDLLPASSDTSGATASTASSTTVTVPYQPNDYQYEQDIFFPDDIPLVNKTQSDIESIIFGSEFPEMLYADEKISMFTDGVGGLYIYDMTQEELTFATDVYDSFLLAIEQFPEDFGGDSWNGISLYALEDGTPLCSLTYPSKNTTKGAGESITEHYLIHTKTPGLERIDNAELKDYPVYHGLSELPYDEKYHAISLSAAHYGDNGEFVYIRNAPADIDLSPQYDMQTIELRCWTEGEVTSDAADGGFYPFTHEVGKYVEWHDHYLSTVQSLSDGTEYNTVALVLNDDKTFKFNYNTASSTGNTAEGTYEIAGDLISLDFNDGGNLVYRNDGATLFPCTAGTAGLSDDIIAVSTALLYSEIKYDVLQHEREKYDELQQMFEEQLDARTIELEKYEQLQQSLEEHRQALERLENEQDALVLQEEIQKLTEKREELLEEIELLQQDLEQLEQHENEEDKLAMYLSMLRRGSSFDGNYFAPDFVNILDGEWFVSTWHGYDDWRGGTHNGIDIPADMGDPIYAAADGTARVPDMDDDWFSGYGKTVVIMHDGGYFTVYAQTNEIHVSDGERVTAGQHIADVGSTGWSTGPHLHFEVYKGQTPVDPVLHDWFHGPIYDTGSVWYKIHTALDGVQLPDVPETMWCPVDISYEFTSELDDSGRVRFNGLEGVSVLAASDGEVIDIVQMKYEEGICVVIRQTDGFVTLYHSVDNCIVSVGDHVKAGLKIGQIGEWGEIVIDIIGNNKERVQLSPESFGTRCYEDITNDDQLNADIQGIIAPVAASAGRQIIEVMYGHGGYYGHKGIDFAAELYAPVYAALDGKVVRAEWNGDYGNFVMLEHENGVVTTYGHLAEISVEPDDVLSAGDQLGSVGSTGRATGIHLHFEVLKDGEYIDPMPYFNDYPISPDCVIY